jgi:tRNA A37 threonylcarbamoyladenosine modification protein TsaB
MYLFFDNSQEEKIIFILIFSAIKTEVFTYAGKKAQKGILFCFDDFLKRKKISLKNFKGFGVKIGIGRFTATRVAVTFANTLSFLLKKPVVGLESFSTIDFLKKIKKGKKGVYLSAKYSGEANIGRAKKSL